MRFFQLGLGLTCALTIKVQENQQANLDHFMALESSAQSEILESLKSGNSQRIQTQWGFLKNIVNIDRFFASGASASTNETDAQRRDRLAREARAAAARKAREDAEAAAAAKKKAEEEAAAAAAAKKKAEEAAAAKAAEEAAQAKADAEAKAAALAKKKAEEAAAAEAERARLAAIAAKKAAEEEEAQRKAAEAALQAKLAREAAEKKKREEAAKEAARKEREAEAARLKAIEEEKKAQALALKKQKEAEEAAKKAAAEAAAKAKADKEAAEALAKKKAEEAAALKAQEEADAKAALEAKKKLEAEALAAKKKLEEEALAAKKKAEEDALALKKLKEEQKAAEANPKDVDWEAQMQKFQDLMDTINQDRQAAIAKIMEHQQKAEQSHSDLKEKYAEFILRVPAPAWDRVKMRYTGEELHSEYRLVKSLKFNHEEVRKIYKKFAEMERDAFIHLMTAELGAEGLTGPGLAKAKSTFTQIKTGMDTMLNLALTEHMEVLNLREKSLKAQYMDARRGNGRRGYKVFSQANAPVVAKFEKEKTALHSRFNTIRRVQDTQIEQLYGKIEEIKASATA